MSHKEVFSNIYENYGFGSTESRSGPGSTMEETKNLRNMILLLIKAKGIKSVVDVPCGDFNWMKEIVHDFEYHGYDIVQECVDENNKLYKKDGVSFYQHDLLSGPINKSCDLMIVRDIIGHYPLKDGITILKNILKSGCKHLLATTWYNIKSGVYYHNKHDNAGADYGRFYPVCLMAYPFNFPAPDLVIEEDVVVDGYEGGNRKVLALWEINKIVPNFSELLDKKVNIKNVTIVTGLWDMGRGGLTDFKRDFSHYLDRFADLLSIDQNMVIYIPASLELFVWKIRNANNTRVIIRELEDFKKFPFYSQVQKIRTDPEWFNQAGVGGWLSQSPQATLEYYDIMVMSKMFMLHDNSIFNYFNSDYYVWLDAGLSNTVDLAHLKNPVLWEDITKCIDPFLFISYPYDASTGNNEIHGFRYPDINRYAGGKDVKYVCRGGMFGARKEALSEANGLYYSLLSSTLSDGLMGTEESIFAIMAHLYPDTYRRYALAEDNHGLIAYFTGKLIAGTAEITGSDKKKVQLTNKDVSEVRVDMYILTYEAPFQLRHMLKTYYDIDWINKFNKVWVIDNSAETEENSIVCLEYGVTHVITGSNMGINGGRQFVAEHFDSNDADYYIFFEDDMTAGSSNEQPVCRNGFRTWVPNLFEAMVKIMLKEDFDYLKLCFSEIFIDNYYQVSWYNVPQEVRNKVWPEYDKLPVHGHDMNSPKAVFTEINSIDGLAYAKGQAYYCNWPLLFSRAGNKKVFLDVKWGSPFEQTWMSYVFQEQLKGNILAAVLLASPINHNRLVYYEGRREN